MFSYQRWHNQQNGAVNEWTNERVYVASKDIV